MDYLKKASLLALIVSFSILYMGCSSLSGPLFKEITDIPSSQSLIYLYRPNDNRNTDFLIKCNDKEMCVLKNNGYFPFFVGEGKTEISSVVQFKMFTTGLLDAGIAGSTDFVFKSESGKTYYVECQADESGGQRLTIKSVPQNYGSIRIKECRLLPAKDQSE